MKIFNQSKTRFLAHWPLFPKDRAPTEEEKANQKLHTMDAGRTAEVPDPLGEHLLKGWPSHFLTDEEANRQANLAAEELAKRDKTISEKEQEIIELKAKLDLLTGVTSDFPTFPNGAENAPTISEKKKR